MNHKYKLMLQGILEITYLDMIDYSDALQNELMRCSHPYSVSAIAACLANASKVVLKEEEKRKEENDY